ncbi:unnamed protein product [Mesocestoides corti]|uniref:LIM zinc-binding domain-containing protein n=1 Tax=Mesocestoides corti TaxID=53468 RepID=A0A0R3UBQ3_MESCO|nr:unnamed protein product [Mesocestoides corti]
MSDYFYGRRPTSLASTFNERAGPRTSDDRRFHHPVKPAQRTPHYAQVSELYPMQARSDSPSDFRYRPTADITMPESSLLGSSHGRVGGGGGGVAIPVVHLSSPSSFYPSRGSVSRAAAATGPVTSGTTRSGSGSLLRKTTQVSSPTFPSDPEAEVDALTNVLIQRMETPRSGGIMSPHEASSDGTASPAGSIQRGGGGGSVSSRIGRLQQQQTQQRVGSPSTMNLSSASNNTNNGSPLTIGSPRTSSPTNSSGSSGVGDSFLQNNCFRCQKPLVPPEGTTLGPGINPPPIVTLTGALAVRLHEACFTCYLCRTKLNPEGYYHSVRRLLCPTCVRDGAVESCAKCRRPIGERVVRALGAPYHPSCFVCSMCQTHLDSKPFTLDVHDRPLCLEDFHRRYAPRCAVCSRPITPEAGSQEAQRVVAGDGDYHLRCYGVRAPDSASTTPTPSMAAA